MRIEELESKVDELGVNLHLLGHRDDIAYLMSVADVYILPSKREGLNVSLMEAVCSGYRCIASDIRGDRELLNGVSIHAGLLTGRRCI